MPKYDEAREWTDRQLKKLERKMRREYSEAAKEANKELARVLNEYDALASENSGSADKERDKRVEWLSNKRATLERLAESFTAAAIESNRKAMQAANDVLPAVYSENANHAAYEIDSAINMYTKFNLVNEQAVRELMMADDAPISRETVWFQQDPGLERVQDIRKGNIDAAKDYRWNRQKFTSSITQGILLGESIPNISKRVSKIFGGNMAAATRAARTATTSAENAGRLSSYERAQRLGIELVEVWRATLDGRTRDSHRLLDGETVEVGEMFHAEGGDLRFPGDPQGPAEEVYNCRCGLRAHVKGFENEKGARWSRLPDGVDYEAWKIGGFVTDKKNRQSEKSISSYISALAALQIKKAEAHEQAVTELMQKIAGENGMYMHGLEHRLKGQGSMARKIRSDAEEIGGVNYSTLTMAANKIGDGLRYTMIATPDGFGDGVKKAFEELYAKGYSFTKVKDTLAVTAGTYRGLNTNLRTPDGYVFELQFHTEETFNAKDKAHAFYEIERVSPKGSPEQIKAHEEGASIFRSLKTPNGAGTFTIDTGNPKKPVFSEVVSGIASLDAQNELDGGFTINLRNGRAYRLGEAKGYGVGGYGTEVIVKKEDYQDEAKLQSILEQYYVDNANALAKPGACLGGWVPSTGEHAEDLFLDVSVVIEDRKRAAIEAIMKGEDSITDFENIDWPSTEELAKEYGMMKEYIEARKKKLAERG